MKRIARASDTGDVHELATFTGNTGATMPRHAHLSSHAAVLVLRGEVEFELGGERWTMMRGDFANLPPGTPHGWTMRSDGAQIALVLDEQPCRARRSPRWANGTTGRRSPPASRLRLRPAALARAAAAGDFQLAPAAAAAPAPVRVSNKQLPVTPGAVRARGWRWREVRRQYVPRAQCQHERAVPVHHD